MPRATCLSLLVALSIAAAARADRVSVEVLADCTAVEPGGEVTVALIYSIEPHWHIYWTNPGDTGAAPSVTWELPPGVTARPPQFPVPSRIDVGGGLTAFGYENAATLLTTIKVPANAKDAIDLKASLATVVCAGDCEFEQEKVSLHLPVGTGKTNAPDRFAAWQAALPTKTDKIIEALFDKASGLGALEVPLPAGNDAVDFFPPNIDSAVFEKATVVSRGDARIYRVPFRLLPGMSLLRNGDGIVVTRRAGGPVEAAEVHFKFPHPH